MSSSAAAKTKRRAAARQQRRPPRAAARLVRPPSPPAAVAAAGGRAGRSVPGLAVGNHAAADRRQDGRAVFREISGALARCRARSAAPRRTTCCGCGPGSAIIRARAICMPARWRCCATMAGCFPTPRKACARCRGSGPTRRRRSRAIAFDIRTMPVDGNIERVVSRLYAVEEPLPQAKPLIQELAATLLGRPRRRREVSRRR